MQTAVVSRHLTEKYEHIDRDGREQYTLAKAAPSDRAALGHLLDAQVHFAQAWAVADVAVQLAPNNQYARWTERRSKAFRNGETTRQRIEVLLPEEVLA